MVHLVVVDGDEDDAVPWDISIQLMKSLTSADVQLTLVKGGDHRLSSPADLALLQRSIESLVP